MNRLVAVDLGGTHARFALASVEAGKVVSLGEAVTLRTADHPSLEAAWAAFAEHINEPVPRAAAIAIACPVSGDVLRMTNNPWIIRPARIDETLGIDRHVLINDFEAVGHAVAQADDGHFVHVCGPDIALPRAGAISIVGPGTGLGVAHVLRNSGGYHVQATEGGHIAFAPVDDFDDALLQQLRLRHGRVSVERVVSGPGLVDIHEVLAGRDGEPVGRQDDRALWMAGLAGEDSLAVAAIERFCQSLGSVAGDIALAQGGAAVVLAGGLGLRLQDRLSGSGFAERFRSKGRFEGLMATLPVKVITHPQPGLFGAAAAFARAHA